MLLLKMPQLRQVHLTEWELLKNQFSALSPVVMNTAVMTQDIKVKV